MNTDIIDVNETGYLDYICKNHNSLINETLISPGRAKCRNCKKKRVCGFSNPNHVTNPFGYLYLVPKICMDCSISNNKCMWCE